MFRIMLATVLLVVTSWAQSTTHFGSALVGLPDQTGDGVPDYALHYRVLPAPGALTGTTHLELRDGVTDAPIWGISSGDEYGSGLCTGDWNGDGATDLIAFVEFAFPNLPGSRIDVIDPATGLVIATIPIQMGQGYPNWPSRMLAIDFNGDGRDEIVLADLPQGAVNRIFIFDSVGVTRTLVLPPSFLDARLIALGDANGNGVPDFAIGEGDYNPTFSATTSGVIQAIDGATLSPIWSVTGPTGGSRVGRHMAKVGDHDADGLEDFVIVRNGKFQILSAATGFVVAQSSPVLSSGVDISGIVTVPDFDGDGLPDFMFAGSTPVPATPPFFYARSFYSSASFLEYQNIVDAHVGETWLDSIVALPDTDKDGVAELMVGEPGRYSWSNLGTVTRQDLGPFLGALAAGTVGFDILTVNGSAHLPGRRCDVAPFVPFTIELALDPASAGPTDFIIWGYLGIAAPELAYPAIGFGTFIFPPRPVYPAAPALFCLADSTGFDGTGVFPANPAPWVLGAPFGLPGGLDLSLQGLTFDGATTKITNGILLRIH